VGFLHAKNRMKSGSVELFEVGDQHHDAAPKLVVRIASAQLARSWRR
jgi:hypothetical protein